MHRNWVFTAVCLIMAAVISGCTAAGSVSSGDISGETAAVSEDISGSGEAAPGDISDKTEMVTEISRGENVSRERLLECRYYDEIQMAKFDEISAPYEVSGELTAGVVTHHLLAGRMIASFFKTAAQREGIETVVIIAPMHYPKEAHGDIITTMKGWQTPYGEAECDREISALFKERLGAQENDEMLQYDHSASVLLPFISRYLPGVKVSCLLISGMADRRVPEETAQLLYEISGEKECLFIFSADFAHYMTPEETLQRDSETLEAIMSGDTAAIELMGDEHTDTPRCICTFIRLMELTGGSIAEIDHSESSGEAGLPFDRGNFPEGVTSYFILGGETG